MNQMKEHLSYVIVQLYNFVVVLRSVVVYAFWYCLLARLLVKHEIENITLQFWR